MKRPFADKRPIGPFMELLSFNQGESGMDVEYTLLFSSPSIPSSYNASKETIDATVSMVENELRRQFDLSESQYTVFTESIVPEEMRQDGNLLVVKLKGVNMTDGKAATLQDDLARGLRGKVIHGEVDSMLYKNDFFMDSNAREIEQ